MLALGAVEDVTGEAPAADPSSVSVYAYGGGLVGVQWAPGDTAAQTQIARTGGAEPTSVDTVVGPGVSTYESGDTEEFFWWVRHLRNGQTTDWVLADVPDTGTGVDPTDPLRPVIDSVVQTTPAASCVAGCTGCLNIRINVTMVGSSQGTLQERVNGGSWSTVDSGVTAGATALIVASRDAGKLYEYRLRYNDVSPATWSTTGGVTTECELL